MPAVQTTGAITLNSLKLMIGTTTVFPTSALDISGIGNSIEISGGDLATIEAFTFGTATPIIQAGSLGSLELKVKVLYTENAGDGYSTLATWYEAKTPVALAYSPKGGTAGQNRFVTALGYITSHPYPAGDAEGSEFATLDLTVKTASITRSTAAL